MKHVWMTFLTLSLVFVTGCERDKRERLLDPRADGSVPQSSGVFIIFDDELRTGGGLGFIPGGGNQEIELVDQSSPRGGLAQIRYAWNGQPVASQQLFAGFSLLITPDFTNLSTTQAKDLSSATYGTLRFSVRGSLSENTSLRVEGPSDGSTGATPARLEIDRADLPSSFGDFSLAIPAADFSSVRVFVTFSLQYSQPPRSTQPGTGGTIFLDNIRYEQ